MIVILKVERGENGVLWGTVNYRNNLIVDSAPSLAELEVHLKTLLKDFHGVDPETVEFSVETFNS